MRLLVIEPGLKLWGSERAFLTTVPELVEANVAVVVLLPPEAELVGPLRDLGVTVEPAPIGNLDRAGWLARLRAAAAIALACRRHRIEKIYLNQAGLCRIVNIIAGLLRLPLAVHVRLVEDVERCARLPMSTSLDLIHISEDMRRRHPVDAIDGRRIVTVHDPFVLSEKVSENSRSRLISCVGRIAALKGQLELIEGLSLAIDQGVDATLDIIGDARPDNPYGETVHQRASSLGGAASEARPRYRLPYRVFTTGGLQHYR